MRKIILTIFTLFFISSFNLYANRISVVMLVGDEVSISKTFWENPSEFLLTQEFKKRHRQRDCFILASLESNVVKEAKYCDNWKLIRLRVFYFGKMMSLDEKNQWNYLKSASVTEFFFSEDGKKIKHIRGALSEGLNGSIFKHGEDNSCYETKKVNKKTYETFKLDDFGYCALPAALTEWIDDIEMHMQPYGFVYNTDKRIWPHKDFKSFIRNFEAIP
jgi:hypothetical protein